MKQIIDIETWERKENFNFFRRFQNPQLSITSEVECGGAKKRAKEAHQSFFLHYLYAVLRAANEIPELRYRIDPEGRVVLYDQIDRDIPKIIKFKATNSLRVSCLFCIFKHSPKKTV